MNADGSDVAQLTTSPAVDGQASWSPDGSKIVFQSPRHREVAAVRDERRRQRPDAAHRRHGRRLPAGVVARWDEDRVLEHPQRRRRGSVRHERRRHRRGGDHRQRRRRLVPGWSPDGTRSSSSPTAPATSRSTPMNADGTDPVQVTSDPASDSVPTGRRTARGSPSAAPATAISRSTSQTSMAATSRS